MIQIGAQLYTVRDYMKTPFDIRETFKRVADIGYKCVQVSGNGPIAAEELRNIANETELKIIVTHIKPERILNETQSVIDEHKIFGCSRIGIGSIPLGYKQDIGGFEKFISDYSKAAKLIKESGLEFYYHNHEFEFIKNNGVCPYDIIAAKTSWSFLPDVYWLQYAGKNPARVIKELKGRSEVIHIKDMATVLKDRRQIMTPIFSGNMDYDSIFKACDEADIKYAMVEQDDSYGKNPFDELKTSFENLKKAGYIK